MTTPLPSGPASYCLRNPATGAIYVGSTGNLQKRICTHKALIANGDHYNSRVKEEMRDFDAVEIEYVEHPTREAARKREQSLLDFYKGGDELTNVATSAYSPWSSGNVPETHRGGLLIALEKARLTCYTPEVQARKSASLKGRVFSEETRAQMSASAKLRGISDQAIAGSIEARGLKVSIDGTVYRSVRDAGRQLNVGYKTVDKRVRSDQYPTWKFI